VLEATVHGSRGVLRVKLIYGLARTIVRRRRPRSTRSASPRTSSSHKGRPQANSRPPRRGSARPTANLAQLRSCLAPRLATATLRSSRSPVHTCNDALLWFGTRPRHPPGALFSLSPPDTSRRCRHHERDACAPPTARTGKVADSWSAAGPIPRRAGGGFALAYRPAVEGGWCSPWFCRVGAHKLADGAREDLRLITHDQRVAVGDLGQPRVGQ
jgi:hypothetical protein